MITFTVESAVRFRIQIQAESAQLAQEFARDVLNNIEFPSRPKCESMHQEIDFIDVMEARILEPNPRHSDPLVEAINFVYSNHPSAFRGIVELLIKRDHSSMIEVPLTEEIMRDFLQNRTDDIELKTILGYCGYNI